MKKLTLAAAIATLTTLSMSVSAQEIDTFQLDVEVVASCELVTTGVDFGEVDAFGDIDATTSANPATLDVTCTNGAAYDILLTHGGELAHANGTSDPVTFVLFEDAAFTQVWDDTEFVSETGTGDVQNFDVFAQLAIDNTTEVGAYSGEVTVTVNF